MEDFIDGLLEEVKTRKLSASTSKVFQVIHHKWPINPLEVAEILGDDGKAKSLSAKYVYHFKKLNKRGLIRLKKIGNTYVAWPVELEKLRTIHELLRGV